VGRRAARAARRLWPWALTALVALLAIALVAGIGLAGSASRIPAGVTIAGVNVGGLNTEEARAKLERLAAAAADVPVVFTAAGKKLELTPASLDAHVNWTAAIEQALDTGDGPLPLRGLQRLKVRLLGVDVRPLADVYDAGLSFRVDEFANAVHQSPREAAIELDGLTPRVVPAQAGRELDRDAAKLAVVTSFGAFARGPVTLAVRTSLPSVTTADLAPVAQQVRTALSAPVRFGFGDAHWQVTPRELAQLLELPSGGDRALGIGGPAAAEYFKRLSGAVRRPPKSAAFALRANGRVAVVPGLQGRALDVEASGRGLLTAALSRTQRDATLVVRTVDPKLTTLEAEQMGIERVVGTYHTAYAGTYDRIQNLRLAAALLDETLIAPGATFSFNDTVGPRTEERGFRAAPIIIGNEYEDGIGGGVSQVATTVFNAAWEAGLKITERNAHALYISRYEAGRDATVNYPTLDLKFVNDTGKWVLLRAGSDDSGIWVSMLGAKVGRRVVSEAGELQVVAEPKVEKVLDPTLFKGEEIVEELGEPMRAVAVRRVVYEDGNVLYDEIWRTTYRSQPKVLRVGTLPVPETDKPPAPPEVPPAEEGAETPAEPPTTTPPTETTPPG